MQQNIRFDLKPLSKQSIPAALEKAVRYRLLNEPGEAESICLDILNVEPNHQEALRIQLLALTDRFANGHMAGVKEAQEILGGLTSEYDKHYFAGIISERRAKAHLELGVAESSHAAYEWLIEAMSFYNRAEGVRPQGNDDALLRWNTCAREIMRLKLSPRPGEKYEPSLE
ncbi:MAG: hypothetical protein O2960_05025 [Verrucomicrobia bacterium]|nr:hypothetical protein [Verrucomicrobiota bacterium]